MPTATRQPAGGQSTARRTTSSLLRAIAAVATTGLLASGCSTDTATPDTTTTTQAETTTTSTTEATTTTLSDAQINNQAIDEAETEVTRIVTEWWTFPYDTDLGEAGSPDEFLTGIMLEREYAALAEYQEAGRRLYARSESRLEVSSAGVDLQSGTGIVEFCGLDGTAIDTETGETQVPDGRAWKGTAHLTLTTDGWRINDYFSDQFESLQGNGGETCVLSS